MKVKFNLKSKHRHFLIWESIHKDLEIITFASSYKLHLDKLKPKVTSWRKCRLYRKSPPWNLRMGSCRAPRICFIIQNLLKLPPGEWKPWQEGGSFASMNFWPVFLYIMSLTSMNSTKHSRWKGGEDFCKWFWRWKRKMKEKLLILENGDHHRKTTAGYNAEMYRSWEPSPTEYICVTAPTSMAYRTLQKRGRLEGLECQWVCCEIVSLVMAE